MKTIALALLFISTPAFADDWSRGDSTREAVYLALHGIDWAQTRYISRNPDKYLEGNVFLGDNPHSDKVDAYFILTGLAHVYLASALRGKWRKWREPFQYITIGFEGGYVAKNFQIKIGIRF